MREKGRSLEERCGVGQPKRGSGTRGSEFRKEEGRDR